MKQKVLKAVCDVIIDKDITWIISDNWNCLFKYTNISKKIELETIFPETVKCKDFAFSKIIKTGREIYLIPRKAEGIFYYCLDRKEMYKLDIALDNFPKVKNMCAIIQGKFIYCINRFPDTIFKINIRSKKIQVFHVDTCTYVYENIERKIYRDYKEPCIFNGKIVWVNYEGILIMFDMEKESFAKEPLMGLLQEKAERMSNAHKMELRDWITGSRVIKNVLFLFSAEGRVYRYQCGELQMIEDELFQNYVCCSENDNIVSAIFCDIVQLKGEFYFISYYRNKIVKYNASTDQFEAVFQSYMEEWNGNRRSYSLCKVINEEKVALYSYYESCFYILDFLDGSVQKNTWNFRW